MLPRDFNADEPYYICSNESWHAAMPAPTIWSEATSRPGNVGHQLFDL